MIRDANGAGAGMSIDSQNNLAAGSRAGKIAVAGCSTDKEKDEVTDESDETGSRRSSEISLKATKRLHIKELVNWSRANNIKNGNNGYKEDAAAAKGKVVFLEIK